jgi:hypothetical protein
LWCLVYKPHKTGPWVPEEASWELSSFSCTIDDQANLCMGSSNLTRSLALLN